MNTKLAILIGVLLLSVVVVVLVLKKKKGDNDAKIVASIRKFIDTGADPDVPKNKVALSVYNVLKEQAPKVKDYLKTLYKPEQILANLDKLIAQKMDTDSMKFFVQLIFSYVKNTGGSFLAMFYEKKLSDLTENKLACYDQTANLVIDPGVVEGSLNLLASCKANGGDIMACIASAKAPAGITGLSNALAYCMTKAN